MNPVRSEQTLGVLLAGGAFLFWSFVPPYWHLLDHVPPFQVIAHRLLWTAVFMAVLISSRGQWGAVRAALSSRRTVLTLAATGLLVATNWSIFIIGVLTNHLVAVSMGYFINPLVSVLLGMVFLGERLRLWQWVSVGLALAGVAFMGFSHGGLPWISLSLAFTFGLYGLLRKTVAADPVTGTFLESVFVSPAAIVYLSVLAAGGRGAFVSSGPAISLLLAGAGAVSAVPLLAFAAGARRIPLSTVGFLQYVAPTGHLLLGVLAYGEAFTSAHAVSFSLIWLGVLVYSLSTSLRRQVSRG